MLQQALTTFYRRWHALEASMHHRGGLVLDFDMAPHHNEESPPAYRNRWTALQELTELSTAAARHETFHNPAFTRAKLAGAAAYLRALMGERVSVQAYLAASTGTLPSRSDPDELATEQAELTKHFADLGVPWSKDGREPFSQRFGRSDLSGFAADLRSSAKTLVARLREIVPSVNEPSYRIVSAHEDAYWSNWIDGTTQAGVLLRVNTHPRIEYQRDSHLALAAHEIAGHAAHVGTLQHSAQQERVDPWTLNLAVHSCEAYQMEGLAQVMLHLLVAEDNIPSDLRLLERYRAYRGARINDAWLDLEAGAPIDALCHELARTVPLSPFESVQRNLRDRMRDPLFRSYISIYAPSRSTFMRTMDLSHEQRATFLELMFSELWTPGQIDLLLAGTPADEVRATPDPPFHLWKYRFGR